MVTYVQEGMGERSEQVSERPRHFNSLHFKVRICKADKTWLGGKRMGRGKENPAEGKNGSVVRVLGLNSFKVLQDITVLAPNEKLG